MKRRAALLVLAWLTIGLPGVDAEADRWWTHVRFLADDALRVPGAHHRGPSCADFGTWRRSG